LGTRYRTHRYSDRSGWNESVVRALYDAYIAPNINWGDENELDMALNKPRQLLNEVLQSMGYPNRPTKNRSNWTFWKYLNEIAGFVREDAESALPSSLDEWRFRQFWDLPSDWKKKYLGGEYDYTDLKYKGTMRSWMGDEGIRLWRERQDMMGSAEAGES